MSHNKERAPLYYGNHSNNICTSHIYIEYVKKSKSIDLSMYRSELCILLISTIDCITCSALQFCNELVLIANSSH